MDKDKYPCTVWHVPQVPMKAFKVPVATPVEGAFVMAVLAAYDHFQYLNRVKPDYSNAQGLLGSNGDEWEHEATGESVDGLLGDFQSDVFRMVIEASEGD